MKFSIRKAVSIVLCISLLVSTLTVAFASDETNTSYLNTVISPSKVGTYVLEGAASGSSTFNEGIYETGPIYDGYLSLYWEGFTILSEFDISYYATKDIKSVHLIYGSNATSSESLSKLALYDVEGSWQPSGEGAAIPEFNTAAFVSGADFILNTDNKSVYEGFDYTYVGGVDITDYVLEKRSNNDYAFSIRSILSATSRKISGVGLYITYNDNTIPGIDLSSNLKLYESDKDITLSAKVTDSDLNDSISSVTFVVDGEGTLDATKSGEDVYSVTYTAGTLSDGPHTLLVTASDSKGATVSKSISFSVGFLYEMLTPVKAGIYANDKTTGGGKTFAGGIYEKGAVYSGCYSLYYGEFVTLSEFDISSIADKKIKSAQLVLASESVYTKAAGLSLYDITGSWTVPSSTLSEPIYNETPFLLDADFALTAENKANYPENTIGGSYAAGFDITDYVLKKQAEKEDVFDIRIYLKVSAQKITDVCLYVTYDDNTLPKVDLSENEKNYTFEEDIVFYANVTDEDNDAISSVAFSVDGKDEISATLSEGKYTSSLSKGSLLKGKHTLKCVAVDSRGAQMEETVTFTVGKPNDGENNNPSIHLVMPDEFPVLSSAYIKISVYDKDYDEIDSVIAKLGSENLDVTHISGRNYSVNIPEALMTEGTHEIYVEAIDIWGGKGTYTKSITTTDKRKLSAILTADKAGNYIVDTDGIYVINQKPSDYTPSYWIAGVDDIGQYVLADFDLTDYAGYDIEKVELVLKHGESRDYSRLLKIYEVTQDWSVTNALGAGNGSNLPKYSEETVAEGSTSVTYLNSESLVDIGYPSDLTGYASAIDVTDFALGKIAEGNNILKMLMKTGYSRIGFKDFKLLVTYRENEKPKIEISVSENINANEGFAVSANVTDDNALKSVVFEINGQKVETTNSGDVYSANIPSDMIFESANTICVRAEDENGAFNTAYEKLYITYLDLINPDATGVFDLSSNKIAEAKSENTINSEKAFIAKFYIGNLSSSNIKSVVLNKDGINVFTTDENWNVSSRIPSGLSEVADIMGLITQKLEDGESFVTLVLKSEIDTNISDVALKVGYTDTEELNDEKAQTYPAVEIMSDEITLTDTQAFVDISKTQISVFTYPYVVVVYKDGTEDIAFAKDIEYISGKTAKIAVDTSKQIEKIVFLSSLDYYNSALKFEISEYKNAVYKGESVPFASKAKLKTGYFTDSALWSVSGNTSSDTTIDENGVLTVGISESAQYIKVTAQSQKYPALKDSIEVRILEKTSEFDENNIVFKVGILSDIHLRDAYEKYPTQKFIAAMKVLQQAAGGKDELDALLLSGDITDGFASLGNQWGTSRALQDWQEATNIRDSILNTLSDDTMVFYSLGNHDTKGGGISNRQTTDYGKGADGYERVPEYLIKVLSSSWDWETNPYTETSDEYNAIDVTTGSTYERFFGNDIDMTDMGIYYGNRHAVLNGYHFIAVEPNSYSAEYTPETRQWLRDNLEMAAKENPDNPIFVITHPKLYDTVNTSSGYDGNVAADLEKILNDYPQAFVWMGHTHAPLNSDVAIWQEGYTAVEAASTSYLSSTVGESKQFMIPVDWESNNEKTTAQGQLVEIDINNNMRITKVDTTKSFNANPEYGEYNVDYAPYANSIAKIGKPWIIKDIGADGAHLYSYDTSRSANNKKPYFDNETKVVAKDTSDGIEVTFDAANDDGLVRNYVIYAQNKTTGEKVEANISSMYFYYPTKEEMPDTYSWTFTDLTSADDYIISVYPYDEWGIKGEPVSNIELSTEILIESLKKASDGYDAVVNVKNNSGKDIVSCLVAIAFYDENKALLSVELIKDVTILNGKTLPVSSVINASSDDFNAKCFLIDSPKNISPLASADSY